MDTNRTYDDTLRDFDNLIFSRESSEHESSLLKDLANELKLLRFDLEATRRERDVCLALLIKYNNPKKND